MKSSVPWCCPLLRQCLYKRYVRWNRWGCHRQCWHTGADWPPYSPQPRRYNLRQYGQCVLVIPNSSSELRIPNIEAELLSLYIRGTPRPSELRSAIPELIETGTLTVAWIELWWQSLGSSTCSTICGSYLKHC